MTDYLMIDFRIGAAALGNLSAFYFYSYVAMQIPTGVLVDRWGVRRLLSAGALVATLGTFLFAAAPSMVFAYAGRLLIGASVGVAWVALLKLTMQWFPANRFAFANGLALFVGVGGAVSAGVPLRLLVDLFGWRPVMGVSGAVTLFIGLAIWSMVRDDPEERGFRSHAPVFPTGGRSHGPVLSGIGTVLRFRNTWLLAIVPSGIVGPVLAFAGLWGVPFLTTHYGLTPAQSAAVTSTLLVAWALGGPVLGALSDRIGKRKPLYAWGCLFACAGWALLLYVPGLPMWSLVGLVMVVGFASSVVIIGFSFAKESVPSRLSGTVTGVCNMGYMMGPMLLQPLIGWVLDTRWKGAMANGARVYDLGAYRSAFALIVGWSVLATILITFTAETDCRQTAEGNR
ncbi:MAG: MFS transporter [Deltaproteobacteria bacterium]|nr:MFS transporter [Deltaproteobacteria bacterium]